jgi:hypothetical protein
MTFGEVAFSGSRFIFWCVAPVLFLCGVGLPFLVTGWTPVRIAVVAVSSGVCLLAIPALYDSRKFWWAARGVTLIVFSAYATYLVTELLFRGSSGSRFAWKEWPLESIFGFIIIGLPALWYTLFGRFTFHAPAKLDHDR